MFAAAHSQHPISMIKPKKAKLSMPYTGNTFTHLFDWEKDPQRQEKIVNARLEAEFDGIDAALSMLAAGRLRNISVQRFTSSGIYSPPPILFVAIVECVGGGGSGAGGTGLGPSSGVICGGGGGSGGYSRSYATAAITGGSLTVTIGAGGTAPPAGNNMGTNGGQTSFGTICVANGGLGGSHAFVGSVGMGGAGGPPGIGNIVAAAGNAGGSGIFSTAPQFVFVGSGFGGSGAFGGGAPPAGQAGAGSVTLGNHGTPNTGGGGGGGNMVFTSSVIAGGNGGSGVCIVTEFCA
jgi:hypothetical protein